MGEGGFSYGLFFQLPQAPGQDAGARHQETLAQIVLADALGFDLAWLAEMHFIPAYSIMPAPLIVGAAAAALTTRIRIGTGVTLLPLHDPVRAAEDAATLDVISSGRLEYGIGRGSIPAHFQGLNVPIRDRGGRFDEAVEILRLAWGEEPFSYQGAHYRYDDVNVVPKPVQKPHPPIWMAANSDESFARAAAEGWPVFASPITALRPDLRRRFEGYRAARAQAGGGGAAPTSMGWLTPVHVAEDGDQARAEARHSLMTYFDVVRGATTDAYLKGGGDPHQLPPVMQRFRDVTYEQVLEQMAAIGSPAEVRDKLAAVHAEYGVGHFLTWFNAGGLIPDDQVRRSMRLFTEQVAPRMA